jgi:hypothetical protein
MADNFDLRKFLSENKLTKNAQLLKEAQEKYKYFNKEKTGGFYMTTIDGVKIYSLEDSSIMDTCFYALEDKDGYTDFISIDVSGEPVSSEDIQNEQEISSYIADFIEEDINSQLEEEGLLETSRSMKNKMDEVSDPGFDTLMDVVDVEYDGDPAIAAAVAAALKNGDINISAFGHDMQAASAAVAKIVNGMDIEAAQQSMGFEEGVEEAFQPESKLVQVAQQAWAEQDLEKAKRLILDLIEPSGVKSKEVIVANIKAIRNKREFDRYLANSILKFEKLGLGENKKQTMEENKLTDKERRLVEMVQDALGITREDYQNADPAVPNDSTDMAIDMMKNGLPEGGEMTEKEPLPKYENIDKLMQEIEHGTSKAMYEYKMKRMKEIADMLEEKATSLEEGEHAEYTDKKAINQMHKDIKKLRDGVAKLRKEFDKKFNKKQKAAAAKAEAEADTEVEKPTLQEGTFDLRKFLVENKITTNSRMLKEEMNIGIEDIASKFSEAGITSNQPVTYIIDYGNPAGTDPAETTTVSALVRQLAQEVEGSEDVDVMFNTDITQGQGELLGDNNPKTEGLTCKLEVYFEDSMMYEIWQ